MEELGNGDKEIERTERLKEEYQRAKAAGAVHKAVLWELFGMRIVDEDEEVVRVVDLETARRLDAEHQEAAADPRNGPCARNPGDGPW